MSAVHDVGGEGEQGETTEEQVHEMRRGQQVVVVHPAGVRTTSEHFQPRAGSFEPRHCDVAAVERQQVADADEDVERFEPRQNHDEQAELDRLAADPAGPDEADRGLRVPLLPRIERTTPGSPTGTWRPPRRSAGPSCEVPERPERRQLGRRTESPRRTPGPEPPGHSQCRHSQGACAPRPRVAAGWSPPGPPPRDGSRRCAGRRRWPVRAEWVTEPRDQQDGALPERAPPQRPGLVDL